MPDATVTTVRSLGDRTTYVDTRFREDGEAVGSPETIASPGGDVLIDDGALAGRLPGVPDDAGEAVARAVRAGRVVVFTGSTAVRPADLRMVLTSVDRRGRRQPLATMSVRALLVGLDDGTGPRAVLPPTVVERAGVATSISGLLLTDADISARQEQDLGEAVSAVSPRAWVQVERGYQEDDQTRLVQLVLGGLGAVLMLGGTLTATFLALSDARPDLATLAAVGASPRRRRGIAAAYALVVGFVGALLGAAVGFVPGIAISYPLTSPSYADTGPFLDIPWLLVGGVVVALPLITAAIVALCTRSRLPLVARLD
ncbi:hypothetical protein GCM10027062_13580 [Nocardioides hungaricus]